MNRQIKNLEVLKASIEATGTIDLDQWRKVDHTCGTIYCSVGLAASLPYFNEQGLKFDEDFVPCFNGDSIWSEEGEDQSKDMFGPNPFDNLFATRGEGARDGKYPGAEQEDSWCTAILPDEVSDKELAIWRIEQQIAAIKEAA